MEKETGRHIKAVRSDRGGEYTSMAFMEYCEEKGIRRFLTAPYTPQQNGVVERKNRTILDMVRSMLKSKKMPKEFWAKAVQCAIYEKEENGKVISKLVKKVEEGVEKENDLLMEIDALVNELVKEEKDIEMLTQQRDSLDVNLNRVQQETVNLRYTIEILTPDKVEMEEAKMEVENVIVDL
ncbi:uncharacterized protein LOC111453868 [Cucurbita moschata]|uniref:Uncharacterized protein LOC111453868 n=1 Tax=Cucurbita moschata TaxID=3662 RepID=A0A6J1GH80_CUCMO|nr:uncharacterized protein LOC111453868 [Cucurbita moschata]